MPSSPSINPPHPAPPRPHPCPLTHIQNIEAGPVAVLRLRDVLPLGFHGVWTDKVYDSASAFVSGGKLLPSPDRYCLPQSLWKILKATRFSNNIFLSIKGKQVNVQLTSFLAIEQLSQQIQNWQANEWNAIANLVMLLHGAVAAAGVQDVPALVPPTIVREVVKTLKNGSLKSAPEDPNQVAQLREGLPVMQIVNRLIKTELGTAYAKFITSMLTEAPWHDHDVSTLKTVEISGLGGK